ncbi:methylenetetrahydrofolate reduct [Gigaspora margarita]|uniref:Methylenetetrahydrofolate reduct n=1 Tax=Gigaspora margarita TaxID=4874 RepID=A0A8H4EJW0_GIGMA|nr:methylenetetrahydrofolate reduct [Gigaspora margarita]
MKVKTKIQKAQEEGRPYWSFEYFPPKTQQGVQNLYDRMERMYRLGPEFIDITWNAGGTSSQLTSEIVSTAQSVYGLETVMHLTCTNMPKEKIDKALKDAKDCGCQNILALRGDPPRGQIEWEACENGFSYAIDLVRYIRSQYGDYFGICVAGYCEGHVDNPDKDDDLRRLKDKVDAGADFIVTQVFYDVDLFLDWVKKCRAIGITCPIIPGLLPIQNYNGFNRIVSLSKTIVPKFVCDALEPIKHDDAAVKEYGIKLAVEMIKKMYNNGISGFHFYTMNLERSTRLILEALQFVAPVEKVKPLPWCPSLSVKRKKENVRPIFWRNRIKSYVTRTEAWDEFPNGRWGDSRSPAFGELDGYGVSLKQTKQNALELWGCPNSLNDIYNIFGDLKTNTQSEGPNAVTWGVFPGKEIIQPTIVEAVSFMAWKDEAFELWNEWAKIYDPDSLSAKLISQIADNWYLINIVHNDFHDGSGIFRIFESDCVSELVEADR